MAERSQAFCLPNVLWRRGKKKADLHGRKRTDFDSPRRAEIGDGGDERVTPACICVFLCVRKNAAEREFFFLSGPGDTRFRASVCRGVYEDSCFKMCLQADVRGEA